MIPKNILFPTDFSACSGNALYYAVNLADLIQADLVLMHSYDFPDEYSAAPAEQILSMKSSIQKEAEEHMRKLINQVSSISPDVHYAFDMELGILSEHLVKVINKRNIDFVISGTKGFQGMDSVLFGTTTSTIIDIATCPVLIVPEEASYAPVRNILFLSKFQQEEILQLKYLTQLASVLKASVQVVHFMENPDLTIEEKFMRNVKEELDYQSINFKTLKGKATAKHIKELTVEEEIDWMVMYVSRRSELVRIFGPNLTKEISYQIPIPLLVFPEQMIVV